ncbi:MAG: EVE domain-containing protein [Chloroflexi bacterium]|nr:EVE domain-containing protein [Chloroflexota bacterium]
MLYGPPGTGKTWLVNHFAHYFLLHKNVSPVKADAYWQAVANKDRDAAAALRALVRPSDETAVGTPSFWWITANPAKWSWDTLFKSGEEFFSKGRIARNFDQAKAGDLVFGYVAYPQKQMVAIARVKEGPHTRMENDKEVEGILIQPEKRLAHPLDWQAIVDNELLKQSEPITNNARGTLFHLSPDEVVELSHLLTAAGNDVPKPSLPRHDFLEFVTFHQSFSYEEFVEGLRPLSDGIGGVRYEVVDGAFKRICRRAERDREHTYLLVVDEINRANIAKVLGELITLIEDDKRLGQMNEVTVTLPYSQERFGVPPNLYIIGTLNTADRSIALLNLALRRRLTFVELMPDPTLLGKVAEVDVRALLERLNERIAVLLDKDHQLGHSYFLDDGDTQRLRFVWYHRVLPLLQEYFYNDGARLRAVLGDKFVRPLVPDKPTQAALGDLYEPDSPRYEVVQLPDDEFLAALRAIAETPIMTGVASA